MSANSPSNDKRTNRDARHCANAIRALSMDAVQKANSGHPGMPMGMADMAEVLWNEFYRHNPGNPAWANRDRFVLSNGHGSMLQYALLHLSGYALTIDDLKNFRQLHSKTPGHPENGVTPGIETTTGPLGQGIANAVGMALAESLLANQFNRDGHTIVDHHTYTFLGDGCLMEGISHEVCSLAGTMKLGKLIALYDDNGISIDGEVEGWFTDDTTARFQAYGWQVISDVDGHDAAAVRAALEAARTDTSRPTLIACKTTIGFGSPNKAGSHDSHGAPLGDDEIAATRKALGWAHGAFEIPDDVYAVYDARADGKQAESAWQKTFDEYRAAHPELAAEFERRMAGKLPDSWASKAAAFIAECAARTDKVATRKASEISINGFAPILPEMLGGSADLTGSNLTTWSGSKVIADHPDGNYVQYGVREFGMAAIMNGAVLHGGFIPYGGTFLVFSDYARNAIRMASITHAQSIFVLTHDSIGLGEDGPTHQPVEHVSSLRQIPGVSVWRPCDLTETAVAWQSALEKHDGPSCLALTRQGLEPQGRNADQVAAIAKGGYTLVDCEGEPEMLLLATGSEVALAVAAGKQISDAGTRVRIVSMPCCDLFDQQSDDYRESVLPDAVRKRVAIEAGVPDFWRKYVGLDGKVIGMDSFGESAPAGQLFELFGFTVENIVKTANG